MNSKLILTFLATVIYCAAFTQHLEGIVYHLEEHQSDEHGHESHSHKEPLPGANVYWAGTTDGTSTDENGHFHLHLPEEGQPILVVSYISYKNDSIYIQEGQEEIEIVLSINTTLQEVVITNKASGAFVSRLDPILTQNITGAELQKAACCNLSESFETNASVDVSYSDAVTGAKQIQLLGLQGHIQETVVIVINFVRQVFGMGKDGSAPFIINLDPTNCITLYFSVHISICI